MLISSIEYLLDNNPAITTIQMLCQDAEPIRRAAKRNSNFIRKGRWFYYKYKDKLFYLKLIEIHKVDGTKVAVIKRDFEPRIVDYREILHPSFKEISRGKAIQFDSFEYKPIKLPTSWEEQNETNKLL